MRYMSTSTIQQRIPLDSCVFMELDVTNAFYMLEVEPESRNFLAFPTSFGILRYTRMPFGMMNAPAYFDMFIAHIFSDLRDEVISHVDDICVFGSNSASFRAHALHTLSKIEDFSLPLKATKIKIGVTEAKFCGRVLRKGGVFPSEISLEAVLEAATPENPRATRSLLGVARWIDSFVPGLNEALQPLNSLTGSGEFGWIPEIHDRALARVKRLVTKYVGNGFVDWNHRHFVVYTDASKFGSGGVLLQRDAKNPEMLRVLEIGSHAFNSTQSRWSPIEREAFGIVWAMQHFKSFLLGSQVEVRTDCKPLMFILRYHNDQHTNGRIGRWVLGLQVYRATFVHVAGTKNSLADLLSRLDEHEPSVVDPLWNMPSNHRAITSHLARIEMDARDDPFIQLVIARKTGGADPILDPKLLADLERIYKRHQDNLKIDNGLLFYQFPGHMSLLRVIPADSVLAILALHHGNVVVGHWGTEITQKTFKTTCVVAHSG